MGGVGLIDKKMKKNQGKIGDFAALAGLKRASDDTVALYLSFNEGAKKIESLQEIASKHLQKDE